MKKMKKNGRISQVSRLSKSFFKYLIPRKACITLDIDQPYICDGMIDAFAVSFLFNLFPEIGQ